jgi:HD-GYP domain-containing protein (c-di-GMP phosphodiesterase class II)
VPFARWHHERFDGNGYPDRRGGHEVPLTIALVAVCDCWDAITEPRPYRTVFSSEDAIAEMEKGAGRQWSRSLVNWLLETVTEPAGQARAG